MSAPAGNQFWKLRATHGRHPIIEDHEQLWSLCCEYFDWVEANPLIEYKAFSFQGEVIQAEVPKMRAMTIEGLCICLCIDPTTWREWRKNQDFSPIVRWVESVIYDYKFTGAAAGLLNANIIARDLGLKDISTSDHKNAEILITPTRITRTIICPDGSREDV